MISNYTDNKLSTNRAPRVLLIAEAANPEWVSVPLVGWGHARAILDLVDGHLITHIRNREAIIRAGLVEGRDFTAIDSESVSAPIYKLGTKLTGGKGKGWTLLTAVMGFAYYYFEYKIWQQFGKAIKQNEYDIVHRITPLSPTTPSILASRCKKAGVPFILGPLNGGLPWPKSFDHARRKENEWLSYVRSAYKLFPYYRSTLRDTAAILVASQETLMQIPAVYQDKCFYLPENAIDTSRFPKVNPHKSSHPIRAVFLGRLVPYKGPDMLLEALSPLLRNETLTLDILGDGPMMSELKSLVQREKIQNTVKFHGWVEHQKIKKHLMSSDVLTFPSIREFGGGVVLEAMAMGVVPIVVNYGGPGELVTPKTGFAIPIGTRAEIIEHFRETMIKLVKKPAKLEEMSALCIRRAHEQFTWDAKAQCTFKLYQWLLNPTKPKPDFPFPIPDPSPTDD